MPYSVKETCLTNYKNKFLFVSGGVEANAVVKRVAKYNAKIGTWSTAPSMNQGRKLHNSVAVGHKIYVFFGFKEYDQMCKSVEALNAEFHINNKSAVSNWELIITEDENCDLILRSKMIISTIDAKDKIVIFGGRDENNNYCKDIEIFDPKTRRVELYHSNIEFVSVFNPSAQFKNDTIVALGLNNAKHLQLVEWCKGKSNLNVLADFN